MNIYIIRHGETSWNKEFRVQGRSDIPLTKTGIEQAQKTAEAFKNQGIFFDHVYTSPLSRAKQTAKIISGLSESNITSDERLIEFAFGEIEGATQQERETNPKFAGFKNFFISPKDYRPLPGGETFVEVLERTKNFWENEIKPLGTSEYADNKAEKNILITTHGGTLQSLLIYVDKRPLERYWEISFPNCAVNLVTQINGKLNLEWTSKIFY